LKTPQDDAPLFSRRVILWHGKIMTPPPPLYTNKIRANLTTAASFSRANASERMGERAKKKTFDHVRMSCVAVGGILATLKQSNEQV